MTYLVYNSSKYVVVTIQNYFLYYCTSFSYYSINSSYQLNYCVSIKSSVYTDTALNEWLAGIIDFYTGSSPRFSIEMDRNNLTLMSLIQSMTQGRLVLSIKGRPNVIRVDVSK